MLSSHNRMAGRQDTCERLETALGVHKAVLVRSPPYSGKTGLGQIYQSYLENKNRTVLFISLLGMCVESNDGLETHWQSQLGMSLESCLQPTSELTLIIDEAQMLYGYGARYFCANPPHPNGLKTLHLRSGVVAVIPSGRRLRGS